MSETEELLCQLGYLLGLPHDLLGLERLAAPSILLDGVEEVQVEERLDGVALALNVTFNVARVLTLL